MDLNPIVLSIPIFFILIGVELLAERITHRHVYRLPDAVANLSCGITSQLSGLFLKVLAIGIYEILYARFSLFVWDRTPLYWLALFLLADLAYYWAHRMSHEINLFWGGHVVHHQSEDYNLSVALRQSSLQVIWTFAFSLPLAFLGFRTLDYALMSAFITLYQFWIHTEFIGKLGWFEYVFNTPSHHRVHHGRDPKYIDKNHGGTLIIWDKMFGTFQEEEERPTYGVTRPLNSWNAVFANFSHYADMWNDLKRIPYWRDRLRYIFARPGWLPDYLGGYRTPPPVDPQSYSKYHTQASLSLSLYVLFQFTICLLGTGWFLFKADQFTLPEKSFITLLISFTVVNCGVLFEKRRWVWYAEFFRVISYPSLLALLTAMNHWPEHFYIIAIVFVVFSLPWLFYLFKNNAA